MRLHRVNRHTRQALGRRLRHRSHPTAGRRRGGPTAPGGGFRDVLSRHLPSRGTLVVALLSGSDHRALESEVRAISRSARVHVLDPGLDPAELHLQMAAVGRFDLIIDDTRGGGRDARARAVFFHLRPGGVLLLCRRMPVPTAVTRRTNAGRGDGELARLVSDLARASMADPVPAPGRTRADERALADSVASLVVDHSCVVLVNGQVAHVKVREEQMDRVLALRGPDAGRVRTSLPGGDVQSRAVIRTSESPAAKPYEPTFAVPRLSLREYRDVVCLPGQIVTQGNLMLPDSFRHNQRPRLGNKFTREIAHDFAVLPPADHAPHLRGAYFYLDSSYRGHFGHAMTEQISRFWAWPAAKAAEPGLKAIMHRKARDLYDFEVELYAAAGVAPGDLVFAVHPVRVERLLAATPMFSQPEYVHPDIEEVWSRVSDNLAAQAVDPPSMRKIFCARRTAKRACHNAPEVEELFAAHGFHVILSEDYPLSQQAVIFREAEVIAGYAGSALVNLALSRAPKRVVMISSESYIAQNEYMIASVLGHELNVAWCRPDVARRSDKFSRRAFHSDFTFDHDREGRFVRDVLKGM